MDRRLENFIKATSKLEWKYDHYRWFSKRFRYNVEYAKGKFGRFILEDTNEYIILTLDFQDKDDGYSYFTYLMHNNGIPVKDGDSSFNISYAQLTKLFKTMEQFFKFSSRMIPHIDKEEVK